MILADRAQVRNDNPLDDTALNFLPDTELDSAGAGHPILSPSDAFAQDVPPLPFQGMAFRPPTPDVLDAVAPPRLVDDSWRQPLVRQVADWLRVFVEEGQVVELRALNVATPNGAKITYSGFYNWQGLGSMAEAAVYWTTEAEGVYFTLNPLDASLLARRYNKVEPARDTAADVDVVKRRWLLVDTDPVRKSGISASDAEKRLAWDKVREAHAWLREQGWPEPVLADSGNGYHLLYRIDLPSDDGGMVKSVLEALAARFDDKQVKIDTKVFNPGRIVKLYGTVARKGDSLRERPHRRTGVLAMPGEVVPVSRQQLEAVGGEAKRKVATVNLPAATPVRNTLVATNRAELMARARNYLRKVRPAISGESGHNQTFKVACILTQQFRLGEEDALAVIGEWNETCVPPWNEKELRKKLKDAAARVGTPPALRLQTDDGQGADGEGGGDPADVLAAREAPDDPHRLARLFLREGHDEHGQATIRCWNGDWYRWDGLAYRLLSEGEVRAGLTRSVKGEFDRINLLERLGLAVPGLEGASAREPSARKVTTALVGNTLQALRSETFVPGAVDPPAWLGGEGPFPAEEALVAKNGIVHLPSLMDGRDCLLPLTPGLFTTVALDYEIDPKAAPPAGWLAFLNELWPDDPQSVELLQEWFGYCLVQDTSQQKMLLVIGPKRAGKGTIARVLTTLVGHANVAGPTLGSLAGEFGLSALIGKPVAIISDARFSGRAADQAVVVERLLSISGEDTLSVNRKNREHLTLKLPTRITVMTNESPRLTDASAALPSRLLVLQLKRSWYGQEDTRLAGRLIKERPGVFLWAVEGLKRLRLRGRFVQPETGQDELNNLVELASPVTAFVQDECRLGKELTVAKRTLFEAWRRWCSFSGHEPGSMATFGRNFHAAFPEIGYARPRDGGARVTTYVGIALGRL